MAGIGKPSTEPVVRELTDDNKYSDLDIQLNALILKEVYGKQASLCILNEAMLSNLSPQQTKKLQTAKETIEKYDVYNWYFNGQSLGPPKLQMEQRKN